VKAKSRNRKIISRSLSGRNISSDRSTEKSRNSSTQDQYHYSDSSMLSSQIRRESRKTLYERNRGKENARKKQYYQDRLEDYENTIRIYEKHATEGPTFVCSCCGGLYFSRSVKIFDEIDFDTQPIKDNFYNEELYEKEQETYFLCHTCHNAKNKFKRNKYNKEHLPRLAIKRGLQFNNIDDCLKILNDLEIRLISASHSFLQIHPLGWDGQHGIIGNVINVPVNIEETLANVLPRKFNETHIFQLNLKRRSWHKSNYKSNIIHPRNVVKALEYLLEQPLYKELNIKIDKSWLAKFTNSTTQQENELLQAKFIIEEDDEDAFDSESTSDKDKENNEQSKSEFGDRKKKNRLAEWLVNNPKILIRNKDKYDFNDIFKSDSEENESDTYNNGLRRKSTPKVKYKGKNHTASTPKNSVSFQPQHMSDKSSSHSTSKSFLQSQASKDMSTSQVNSSNGKQKKILIDSSSNQKTNVSKTSTPKNQILQTLQTQNTTISEVVSSDGKKSNLSSILTTSTALSNESTSDNSSEDESSYDSLIEDVKKRRERDESDDTNSEKECLGKDDYFAANNRYFKYQSTLLTQEGDIPEYQSAPAENKQPLYFATDKYGEETNFIREYGGDICKYTDKLSYQNRCKYEMRHVDRRFSLNIEKIFWSYKKLIHKKLEGAMNVVLQQKKYKSKGKDIEIVAGRAKDKEFIKELIDNDEAMLFLRSIRSSPQYWSSIKYKVNACIRRLGMPAFFITFSPSENNWPELIATLAETLKLPIKYSLKNLRNLFNIAPFKSRKFRMFLLNSDPVTVTRYFENRINAIIKFLNSKCGVFKENPITDYVFRIDFQYRGSGHLHMITWNRYCVHYNPLLKNGTEEKKVMTEKFIKLAEKYLTIERPENDVVIDESNISDEPEFAHTKECTLKYQFHSHRKNCIFKDEFHNTLCKYHFPHPILEETVVLEPFNPEDFVQTIENKKGKPINVKDDYYKLFIKINNQLELIVSKTIREEKKGFKYMISMRDFLKKCGNISYKDYLIALSTSIKTVTVFLKCNSRELMINVYNKEIYSRWRANMDIQLVTDPYSVAVYITTYMMKSNLTTSNLLRTIHKESVAAKQNIKHRLKAIADKFICSGEVGAPQAIYTLLSLPVSRCSRKVMYINVFPSNQRVSVLIDEELLKNISPDSYDIWQKSILEHYSNRPDIEPHGFENMCLAEYASWYEHYTNTAYQKQTNSERKPTEKDEEENDDDLIDDLLDNQNLAQHNDDENVDVADRINNNKTADNPNNSEEEERINKNFKASKSNYIKQKNNDGYVRKRQDFCVLRYKRYNETKETPNYMRVQILLYYPWRNENTEVECRKNQKKVIEKYKKLEVFQEIMKNKATYEVTAYDILEDVQNEMINAYEKAVEDEINRETAKREAIQQILLKEGNLNPNKQFIDSQDDQYQWLYDEDLDTFEKMEQLVGYQAVPDDMFQPLPMKISEAVPLSVPKLMNDEEYYTKMSRLNSKQQIYIMNMLNRLKNNEQFFHFIRGGAGVGKSFLIECIYQTSYRFFAQKEDMPNKFLDHKSKRDPNKEIGPLEEESIYVLVSAFTAKAAYNIGGDTIIRTFSLPRKDEMTGEMTGVLAKSKLSLKQRYKNVKLIIIDEISFVSSGLFNQCNNAIQTIFQNKKAYFAGIPVIVVGDFNQLSPIGGMIFSSHFTNAIEDDLREKTLWKSFELFELTEIMRLNPNEKEFAIALNQLGEYGTVGLTKSQIAMFDSRIFEEPDIPDGAVYLFYRNEDVDKYNARIINKSKGTLHQCKALDIATGRDSNSEIALHTLRSIKNQQKSKSVQEKMKILPNEIAFKKECKYMVTTNLNTKDGIVNGAVGTLKYIEENPNQNEPNISKVFFDFGNKYTGLITRETAFSKAKYLDQKLNKEFNKNWIPIDFLTYTLYNSMQKSSTFKINRLQYPIVPCESMTIHKSQGQTMPLVAVSIKKDAQLNRERRYVAFSRVTSIKSLFLFGNDSIVPEKERNLNEKEKKQLMEEIDKDDVHTEMARLRRNCRMKNRFLFMENNSLIHVPNETLIILYQNIQTWTDNKKKVINQDICFKKANLIHFSSTGLRQDHRRQIILENFDVLHQTVSNIQSNGSLTYQKANKKEFTLVYSNADNNNVFQKKDDVELSIFKYNKKTDINIFVLFIYRHPEATFDRLLETIQNSLNKINYKIGSTRDGIILMGDLNIDFNKHKTSLRQFEQKFKIKPLFLDQSTNNQGNQIDWIFTSLYDFRKIDLNGSPYESYISDHKPLYFELNFLN